MVEIGGYLEIENFMLPMRHEGAIALNSGRNCLAYLIKRKNIKKIFLPKFLCASVGDVCRKCGTQVTYYSIEKNFLPKETFILEANTWLYIVNYYGQLKNDQLIKIKQKYENVIVDNIQAYFQEPCEGVDTIYTCRKFFGVSDGAFLYSDLESDNDLEIDYSYERMIHIMGRYEKSASDFYSSYTRIENEFERMPIRKMSKLTENLLRGIDYIAIANKRTENFKYLNERFRSINSLNLDIPNGPYMYPLYIKNGHEIRKELQKSKIFIATLWPDVFDLCNENELEHDLAKNILPLPVDQRYGIHEMEIIVSEILKYVHE